MKEPTNEAQAELIYKNSTRMKGIIDATEELAETVHEFIVSRNEELDGQALLKVVQGALVRNVTGIYSQTLLNNKKSNLAPQENLFSWVAEDARNLMDLICNRTLEIYKSELKKQEAENY